MLNIDDRLLDLIPQIGADAFTLLLLIASRIDRENRCFPSRETLQRESGFGRDKVDKAIKSLKKHNLISTAQRVREDGKLSTNIYTIHTDLLGVYVSAKNKPITEKPYTENKEPITEFPNTEKPNTENTDSRSIKQSLEVLNNKEVLQKEKINKKEKEIFLPPTRPEAIEYLLSKSEEYPNLGNYSVCEQIAKKYITHFEAENWVKVNNKPIRNWKLDLNKRLEGDWLAPHLFKPKAEAQKKEQWAQMVSNAQDRVIHNIIKEMTEKGKL